MKRWFFTAVSFAVVLGVSVYAVRSNASEGVNLAIPWQAHALAFSCFLIEIVARSFKLSWSAKAVGAHLPFSTSMRTTLGGDFGAAITPARAGAEPARYLILVESGVSIPVVLVVMYTEVFFHMISLATFVFVAGLLFDSSVGAWLTMGSVVGIYAGVIIAIGVFALMLGRRELSETPPPWAKRLFLTGNRWAKIRRGVDRVRLTAAAFRTMKYRWGAMSLLMSFVHIGVRAAVLPAIVYSIVGTGPALGPLVVWPFGLNYGVGVLPAPGGGGAVELAFHASLGGVIPASAFAASLVWWRFYTFYIYLGLGAMVAGMTVLRAIRNAEKVEEEFERG